MTENLFAGMRDHAVQALADLLPDLDPAILAQVTARVEVTPTRDPAHGDMATNAAMVAAKPAGKPPRVLAEAIAARLALLPDVASAEPAGPGFVNLRPSVLDNHAWFVPFVEVFTEARLPWAETGALHSYPSFPSLADYRSLAREYAERGARPT